MSRIYLAPPDVGPLERDFVVRALESGWAAPAGPELAAFENETAERVGRRSAVALASGTAALHLALRTLGVGPGDEVLVPTLTFVATASAVRYVGAEPVLVDSEAVSWNIDPDLLANALEARRRVGRPPAAVITVDLYGQCADYGRIVPLCEEHGVPLLSDAAEALGATCGEGAAGAFGVAAAFSFNGNKILTTSGGGMLVSDDQAIIDRVRHLATHAREPAVHYEHIDLGFNERMSNVLAALGRAQLMGLDDRIGRKAAIEARYREELADLDGFEPSPIAPWGRGNHWLTCFTIDPQRAGVDRNLLVHSLEGEDIEARPTWKPMHLQPLYRDAATELTGVADRVWERGICLPSGSGLTAPEQTRVIDALRRTVRRA